MNERNVAAGAILLAIGLCRGMFGTAYAAVWYAWNLVLPRFALVVVVIGVIMVAAGVQACVTGAQESRFA